MPFLYPYLKFLQFGLIRYLIITSFQKHYFAITRTRTHTLFFPCGLTYIGYSTEEKSCMKNVRIAEIGWIMIMTLFVVRDAKWGMRITPRK